MDPESTLNIVQVGFSMATDRTAPFLYEEVLEDPNDPQSAVVKTNLETKPATVYGFDIGVDLLHNPLLDLVPYTDLNFIHRAGWGWHLGALAVAKLPIGLDLQVPIRLEYRRFRKDYVPAYFGTFYDIERFAYSAPFLSNPQPKARALRRLDSDEGINGYYGDLAFDFANIFQVGATYEDYSTGDPNLSVFVSVPALAFAQFKAYYARNGIQGADDIFKFDERSTAVAQARVEVVSFVYLVGRMTRRWAVDPQARPAKIETIDEWKCGLEASFDF